MKNKSVNIVLHHRFNVFHEFIFDYIRKVLPAYNVFVNVFKNDNVLLKAIEVENVDLIITDLASWFNLMNNLHVSQMNNRIDVPLIKCKVAVILQDSDINVIDKILKMNINAIISMTDDSLELKQAIKCIFDQNCSGKYISDSIVKQLNGNSQASPRERLSKNEWEVIKMFSDGYSLIEIAKIRSRAISTIATQKTSAMRKLNLHNNGELMKYVYMHSIL
ncbi:LuxR C-terminal-related transcriptional regulator [Enterobacter sp. SGAir0187]|uniref:LuxR C-terminal-related transcriptional regulator n=1 Tax=Enterobacter sp. SGAir0187 TaxID=2836161 RepID=UPI0013758629|nr:LuxR C-terminal-related transcriptional regulator [Enterobacter sp. SGAir0187]